MRQKTGEKTIDRQIRDRNLVPFKDVEAGRDTYRAGDGLPIQSLQDIENKVSEFLFNKREASKLTREEVAKLLGMSHQVYVRYERSMSSLKFSRLVHLTELFGVGMLDVLVYAAPQLFGKTEAEAQARGELLSIIMSLPTSTMYEIAAYARALAKLIEEENARQDNPELVELAGLIKQHGISNDEITDLIHKVKHPKRGGRKPKEVTDPKTE